MSEKEEKEGGRKTPIEIKGEVQEKIAFLLDNNAKTTSILRKQAVDFLTISEFYSNLSGACQEVAQQILEIATANADLSGDIILAEFGPLMGRSIDDDDDDDDEEEDDESV